MDCTEIFEDHTCILKDDRLLQHRCHCDTYWDVHGRIGSGASPLNPSRTGGVSSGHWNPGTSVTAGGMPALHHDEAGVVLREEE